MLAAEGAGARAAQPAEDADPGADLGGVLSRAVRSLHRQVPAAGGRQAELRQARRPRHPRQQPRHDAGEEQPRDRGGHRQMAGPEFARIGTHRTTQRSSKRMNAMRANWRLTAAIVLGVVTAYAAKPPAADAATRHRVTT